MCEISFFHCFSFEMTPSHDHTQSLLGLRLTKQRVYTEIRKYGILSCRSSSARPIRTKGIYLQNRQGNWSVV